MEIQPVRNDTIVHIKDENLQCGICFEDYAPKDMVLAKCNHHYCLYCLRITWQYRIDSGDVVLLECVEPTCNRKISEEEVLELCDDEMKEKFIRFRHARLIQREHGAVKHCSRALCDGFATGSRWRPKAICRTCGFAYCWTCNQPWHGWFSRCKKVDKNVEKLYKSFKRNRDIQSCPNCRAQIWKNEGCRHMTCKMCRHQFCWYCNRKWPCTKSVAGEVWCLYHAVLHCPRCPCSTKVNRYFIACVFVLTIIPFFALLFTMVLVWLSLWCLILCTCIWVLNTNLLDPRECADTIGEPVFDVCEHFCCCCLR